MTNSNLKSKAELERDEIRKQKRDNYIFGSEEVFEYGKIRFLTFEEYNLMGSILGVFGLNTLHIYYQYRKGFEKNGKIEADAEEFLEQIKKFSIFTLVNSDIGMDLKMAYYQVFDKVLIFDEDDMKAYDLAHVKLFGVEAEYDDNNKYIPMIDENGDVIPKPELKQMVMMLIFEDEELFMDLREKIMDMNVIKEERVSINPEINAGLERSRKYRKAKNKGDQTSADIVTSIVASTGDSFEKVRKMNVHQVYGIYQRIAQIKNYEASVLYSTVAPDVKIEAWDKHIDLFKDETTEVSKDKFMETTGGLFR